MLPNFLFSPRPFFSNSPRPLYCRRTKRYFVAYELKKHIKTLLKIFMPLFFDKCKRNTPSHIHREDSYSTYLKRIAAHSSNKVFVNRTKNIFKLFYIIKKTCFASYPTVKRLLLVVPLQKAFKRKFLP